jgi:glycosyltransferase involved in cell wall biosynthesis
VSLGRLTRQKRYDVLIEAFKEVVAIEQNTVLLIGGDGPDRRKLEEQINLAGMQGHIRLLGVIDNPNELLENCAVYVNSSSMKKQAYL